jgi:hypothetical protein
MPEYEQTASINAEPDELFDYLADVTNMPEYLPILSEASLAGEEVVVETDIHGDRHRAEGWLHVDALERRMEWGAQDGPYHGWLQVDPADLAGSLVTIHVSQDHESDADEDLAEALENIRRQVAA